MHRRPHLFRCHRCDALVYVAQSSSGLPAIYSCGHLDKLADLTLAQIRPVQDDLAQLLAAVSPDSNYTEAATATPEQFQDDLRRGLRILAGLLDE